MLPAEFCNLACSYCFIYNYREKKMNQVVYDSVIKYLYNKVQNTKDTKKKKILISWYGGEPLLMKKEIIDFMQRLQKKFLGIADIEANIITNGYYLSEDCFRELYENRVRTFQVTFDGAKEAHDVTRRLKDGSGGTFDIIMNNIKSIKKLVTDDMKFEFSIRINFMKNTYKAIFELIDQLSEIIDGDNRFMIYCRPVYNFKTERDTINDIKSNIFTIEEGLEIQTKFTLYISKKLKQKEMIRSISDYLPLPTVRWCGEDSLSNMIVGYDGSIYFCDTLIGDEQFCIGHLTEDGEVDFNNNSIKWRKNIFDMEGMDKCKKCKCLPTCMGSCKRERIYLKQNTPCLYKEEDIYKYMQIYYENEYRRLERS